MVRVISLYNFIKQEITAVEEPVSVAAVPPDILLLAQANNTILVKDLRLINDPGYSIPTVDQVKKIIYSIQGNFIAALENRVTRSNIKVSYTRVYINWEALKDQKQHFPLRARIAGRVTPLSQNPKGLEMIEIPNKFMPDNISCCPISGNILVSSRNILNIYLFTIQVHDISKIHFIDFKQLTFDLHISFKPERHQILEDVIGVQNDEFIHIFRMKSTAQFFNALDEKTCNENAGKVEKVHSETRKSGKKYETINYEKLRIEIEELKHPFLVDGVKEIKKKIPKNDNLEETELAKLDPSSFPIKCEFPTLLLENSMSGSRHQEMFRQNPLVPAKDLLVEIVKNSNSTNNSENQYAVINLCQYRLIPMTHGIFSNCEIQEKFTNLILKPYYSNDKIVKNKKYNFLESNYFSNLKTVACFFGTQQEGYLQCFEYRVTEKEDTVNCENYLTYAFTAPVLEVQLDDCFLHAITEVGLETYTLRAAKHLLNTTENTVCPSSTDPVCLIGLHSFLNLFRMCMTTGYLTLFANNEESSCTLYQLKIPETSRIWKDFLTAAEENKWEAPSTYCEMLGEGHLILKTRLNTANWISKKEPSGNLSSASFLAKSENVQLIENLFRESCALLGDYHTLNKNYQTGYAYYAMSNFKVMEISKRMLGLWEDIPNTHKMKYDQAEIKKGLIFYLTKTLHFYDQKYLEFAGNREEFYNPEIGSLVNSLMDLLETENESSMSDLVLESVVLREFSTDRILKILKSVLSKSSTPNNKDALSLALMCLQRDQSEQAKAVLLTMAADELESLLLQYHALLFASHNSGGFNMFTELAMILIEIYPNVLAGVLSDLAKENRILSLSKVLKIFTDIIPMKGGRLKNSSRVLQTVLENYFKFHAESLNDKDFDYKTTEAMKILIRIYLSFLQRQQLNGNETEDGFLKKDASSTEEKTEDILFYKLRPSYLNQVPPFGPELKQMFLSDEEIQNSDNKIEKTILLKIQCILSFNNLPNECLMEVRNFLMNQTNTFGCLSLQILSAKNVQEALSLLIDFAPQPLGQFSKEYVKEKNDWKFLVTKLLNKIVEVKEDERLVFLYRQRLSEILHHIVESLNMEEIVDIIPQDYEEAERYFALAQNYAQANHLKTLIVITGKQLLASM